MSVIVPLGSQAVTTTNATLGGVVPSGQLWRIRAVNIQQPAGSAAKAIAFAFGTTATPVNVKQRYPLLSGLQTAQDFPDLVMTAFLRIDQDGLPEGTPGRSRTDGLATGALVTLTDTSSGGGSTEIKLLWTPPRDTGAVSSLGVTEDPKVWTVAPTAGKYGTYLVELVRNAGLLSETTERRVIVMRTPNLGLIIPALGERCYSTASLDDDRGEELVDNNATDFADPDLNELPFAAWWRAMHELIMQVDSPDVLVANTIRSAVGEVTVYGAPYPDGTNGGRLVVSPGVCSLDNNDGGEVNMSSALGGSVRVAPLGHFSMPANTTHQLAADDGGDLETLMLLGLVGGAPALGFFGDGPVVRPSITGATTQQQVDSLVGALAALGLVVDAR